MSSTGRYGVVHVVDLFQLGKQVDGMTVIIDMDQAGASMLWGPGEHNTLCVLSTQTSLLMSVS